MVQVLLKVFYIKIGDARCVCMWRVSFWRVGSSFLSGGVRNSRRPSPEETRLPSGESALCAVPACGELGAERPEVEPHAVFPPTLAGAEAALPFHSLAPGEPPAQPTSLQTGAETRRPGGVHGAT